jgi:acyl carrier protein
MPDDFRAALRKFILTELDPGLPEGEFNDDTLLFGHHGVIESLAVLDVVEFLEAQADFQVKPHEIVEDNFGSVTRLVAYAEARRGT